MAEQLNSSEPKRTGTPFSGRNSPIKEEDDLLDQESRHHPLLLAVLADELGCSISDIQDFELYAHVPLCYQVQADDRSLYDIQPSTVGGLSNEFVFSPRLDNLTTS